MYTPSTFSSMDPQVADVLVFWFGDPQDPESEYGQQRKVWFTKDGDFDDLIRNRFGALYEQAAAGQLQDWQTSPHACLALILLLDQFPRNIFRGAPRSFATDDQALALALTALEPAPKAADPLPYDQALVPVERLFLYLPLEHSENLRHQEQSVQLFRQLVTVAPELQSTLDYAIRHRDIIARFGRFPHRNAILGRETTPEEAEFLKQPGSGF